MRDSYLEAEPRPSGKLSTYPPEAPAMKGLSFPANSTHWLLQSMVASPASPLSLLAQFQTTQDLILYWPWAVVLLTGASAGFAVVWLVTHATAAPRANKARN